MQGGYTPLLFAARRGDAASARLLVAAGADVNRAAASGTSPLVVAAHSGHGTLAAFLLSAGADPGAADAGYAALHAAVLRGDPPLVRALLAHGADPDAVLVRGTPARRVSADWRLPHNMIGATPLWVAARFREPEILRLIADYGANPSAQVGGETALMAAIRGSSNRGRFGIAPPDSEEEARRTLESVTAALDAGAEIDARNANGDTALHIAVSRGLDAVVALLAERGAALDARNGDGQPPWGWPRAPPRCGSQSSGRPPAGTGPRPRLARRSPRGSLKVPPPHGGAPRPGRLAMATRWVGADGDLRRNVIARRARALGRLLDAEAVILFGSLARGDHREHSDMDLMAVRADSSGVTIRRNAGRSRERRTGKPR